MENSLWNIIGRADICTLSGRLTVCFACYALHFFGHVPAKRDGLRFPTFALAVYRCFTFEAKG